ncbi:response regulator [Mucilaginibacter myungsuensis]|uniref:Response regulator transcription factor n=1 Tax=Mucilaginibacter myungsuensis TaxID=649104 RepID=A0A929KVQ8_9SPHI|nr:response regulator transcription factor [Mucilaginibacter myungsuensis]MBE9662037.1 response regulator transcription factor [Mucilaginibacter myungsuensis]MDN3599530.1 response regulator transcription factor [Mucilaginibacter myungsuensis]
MIRVLLYEDNPQLRDGLAILLSGTEGFEYAGSFPDCSNVVQQCDTIKPDVILMDINMPNVDGLAGLKLLRKHNSDVKILMLTVFDDNQNVFEAIKSGANGYLLKKTPPAKLLEYIQDAQTGGAPMTSSIASQVLKMFSKGNSPGDNFDLSDREAEVLQLLVNGHSYKMIAVDLYISIDTVRSHIKKIYEKLHVNSKSEAVAKALKNNY